MKFGRLFGWGLVIYAVVYLVWSGLVIHGLDQTIFSRIAVLVSLIAITAIATRSLGYRTERDVIPYAIGWMLSVAALDAVFAVPFAGWALYADWNVWVGYILVLLVPIITIVARSRSST